MALGNHRAQGRNGLFSIRSPLIIELLYQHFNACRMAQESLRTGSETIGSGLVDHHQIAGFGFGEFHAVGQQVERGAQGADDGGGFRFGRVHAVADGGRVVLADDLAEVSGGGEVVVQATVGDEVGVSA